MAVYAIEHRAMLFVVTVTIQTIEAAIGPGHDQQLGRSTSRGQPAGLIQIRIFFPPRQKGKFLSVLKEAHSTNRA